MITGLNRQNTYYTAITVPAAILVAVFTAIPLSALTLSGFEENNVSDDNIDGIYTWTNGSVWVLRVCCGIVTPLVAALSYYLVAKYPLSQRVSDQINEAVNRRAEKEASMKDNESADEISDDSNAIGGEPTEAELAAFKITGSEDDAKLVKEQIHAARQVVLHLSVEEIHRTANGPLGSDGRNLGLQSVSNYNLTSAILSGLTSLMLAVTFFYDSTGGNSQFATVLLAIFILMISLFTYEFLRRDAIVQMGTWSSDKLKAVTSAMYQDFSTYHETLKEKLQRGAIDTSEEGAGDGDDDKKKLSNRLSLFQPINDVKEDERASATNVGGVTPTRGYKRIFSAVLLMLAFTIIVIALDATNTG